VNSETRRLASIPTRRKVGTGFAKAPVHMRFHG
jgi:hypothetical protein